MSRSGLRTIVVVATLAIATTGCAFLTRSSVGSAPANTQANGASSSPSVSADGHYTAFLSSASDLVPGDTNGVVDVFVRDNFTSITTRVSTTATGGQLTVPSADPSISDDGRYVAFVTNASLVAADAFGGDVYVKDRQSGAVTWASVRSGLSIFVADCLGDEISGDGAKVAFHCNEMFPVGEGTFVTHPEGPWVRNLRTASTSGPYSPESISTDVTDYDISGNGGVVVTAWSSSVPKVAIGDTVLGVNTTQLDLTASGVAISGDGARYGVVTAGAVQVAALRKSDGSDDWSIVSRTATGDRVAAVTDSSMSTDGNWFAFTSPDPALVTGDTNGVADVFTRSVASVV